MRNRKVFRIRILELEFRNFDGWLSEQNTYLYTHTKTHICLLQKTQVYRKIKKTNKLLSYIRNSLNIPN